MTRMPLLKQVKWSSLAWGVGALAFQLVILAAANYCLPQQLRLF